MPKNKLAILEAKERDFKTVHIQGYEIKIVNIFEQSRIDMIVDNIGDEIRRLQEKIPKDKRNTLLQSYIPGKNKDVDALFSYLQKMQFIVLGCVIREFTDIQLPAGYKESNIMPFVTQLYDFGIVKRGDESLLRKLNLQFSQEQIDRVTRAVRNLIEDAKVRVKIQEIEFEKLNQRHI